MSMKNEIGVEKDINRLIERQVKWSLKQWKENKTMSDLNMVMNNWRKKDDIIKAMINELLSINQLCQELQSAAEDEVIAESRKQNNLLTSEEQAEFTWKKVYQFVFYHDIRDRAKIILNKLNISFDYYSRDCTYQETTQDFIKALNDCVVTNFNPKK